MIFLFLKTYLKKTNIIKKYFINLIFDFLLKLSNKMGCSNICRQNQIKINQIDIENVESSKNVILSNCDDLKSKYLNNKSTYFLTKTHSMVPLTNTNRLLNSNLTLIKPDNSSLEDEPQLNYILSNNILGKYLSDNERRELIKKMQLYEASQGTIIYNESSIGKVYYIIKEGMVEKKEKKKNKILTQWDVFGELSLIINTKRGKVAKALTNVSLWALENDLLRNMIIEKNTKDYIDRENIINSSKILAQISPIDKKKLALNLIFLHIKKNTYLLKEDYEIENLFFVKEGTACYYKNNKMREFFKGDLIGLISFLNGCKSIVDIKAKTDLLVYILPIKVIKEIFSNSEKMFISFLLESSFLKYFKYVNRAFIKMITSCFDLNFYHEGELIYEKGFNIKSTFSILIHGKIKGKNLQSGDLIYSDFFLENDNNSIVDIDLIAQTEVLILTTTVEKLKEFSNYDIKKLIERSKLYNTIYGIDILNPLRYSKIEKIINNLKILNYCQDEIVVKEGETGDKLFIIKEGIFQCYHKNKLIKTFKPYDFFGEKNVVLNGIKDITVISKRDNSKLYYINKKNLQKILEEENIMTFLSERVIFQEKNVELKDLNYIKTLGEGSFGIVYLVKEKEKEPITYYALKRIKMSKVEKENFTSCIEMEKKILLQIEHPFIIKLIKTLKDKNYIYFLEEYINGISLSKILQKKGRLEKNITQFYIGSLLICVEYLNQKHIIHRDIKPDNILIVNNGYIKLIDFGTSKIIENNFTTTVIGSPLYMAPEILLAETYSYNCDIWSISICFYELICGKYPFINYDNDMEEDDPLVLYKAILNAELSFPSFIKEQKFINLITKLLTRNPTQRLCNINLIKNDVYFENFDWDSLYDLTFKAPFIPDLNKISFKISNKEELDLLDFFNKNSNDKYKIINDNSEQHQQFLEWFENF